MQEDSGREKIQNIIEEGVSLWFAHVSSAGARELCLRLGIECQGSVRSRYELVMNLVSVAGVADAVTVYASGGEGLLRRLARAIPSVGQWLFDSSHREHLAFIDSNFR